VPKDTQPRAPRAVGVIGGGQLARMLAEAASELGVHLVALCANGDDAAAATATRTIVGGPSDPRAVRELAGSVDALTLDHELVDLELLDELVAEGVAVRPSPAAVRFAARKDHQRAALSAAGVPVPRFAVVDGADDGAFDAFCAGLDGPPVVKAARGGYDGRGVVVPATLEAARDAVRELRQFSPVVLEERLDLLGELSVLVVTGADGQRRHWPVVRTIQRDSMCAEVLFPSGLAEDVERDALEVAERVADLVGAVGVLAVELFVTARGVLVNEVATRPHNSGHWTIEGAVTSQFENHLRAVLGLPLGSTEPTAAAAVMVNVVGSARPGDLAAALALEGVHVHDYGKPWRPGRKLGHVTVLGGDPERARVRAWEGAEALGTSLAKEPG
jgi:5-(carboxyamino)imidazole ribonucleotide synthase